ncbi:MAG: dihydrodipicolinate synthase family protein [Thermaerobacter sp.]|nr:dihydrodipicolinate synthase family protein [Thermaerobacter sp.]
MTASTTLSGTWVVLVTPFLPSGAIDEPSFVQEIRWVLSHAVTGVAALGLASEVYTLTDAERSTLLTIVAEECEGKCPWIAGVEHTGTQAAAARAEEAAQLGASAVMAYPPYLIKPDEADIVAYYAALSHAAERPVIVQDAQPWTGVALPVALLARLADWVAAVKIETPPTGLKLSALRDAAPDLTLLGGSGGLHAFDELQRGADGFLIGPLQADDFVRMRKWWDRGQIDAAAHLYATLLPRLLTSMATLDTYVALQKEGLRQHGVIADSRCRAPHRGLDPWQRALAKRWGGWDHQETEEVTP